jgi:hypothetical protein
MLVSCDISSETSVDFQRTTQRYTPEDRTLHNHRCENLMKHPDIRPYVFQVLLANSMELSPSSEASSCAAIQEVSNILWHPNLHDCVHRRPSLIPILSQINPAHTTTSCLSKIHFNIINPPTFYSS